MEVSVGVSITIPIIDKDLVDVQFLAIYAWYLLYSLSSSSNNQPSPPINPSPPQNAIDQSLYTQLGWTGDDLDGDTVTYDVYLDAWNSYPTTKVANYQSGTAYNPGPLTASTTYYWKVVAFDEHGLSTVGPVWNFTTGDGSISPGEMVFVPAGEFQMGCDPDHNGGFGCNSYELPLHSVYLNSYFIDKYEVTNTQYAQCVATGPCVPPLFYNSFSRQSYYDNPTYANYPVLFTSWYDAHDYCAWAGKRLPTEAEWENAARGSNDTRAYPWGDVTPNCDIANSFNNVTYTYCLGDTSQVGSFIGGASAHGVMDMAGNVAEYVSDWFDTLYYANSPYSNPLGPNTGLYKVTRGGSWLDIWITLRTASRSYAQDTYIGDSATGFRCAVSSQSNIPPLPPNSPSPSDGALNISQGVELSWAGGNPDGDPVTYDIFFEAGDTMPDELVSNDQIDTYYDPGTLNTNTDFFWQIIVHPWKGAISTGPIWNFTTNNVVHENTILVPAGEFQMGCDHLQLGKYITR